MSVVASLPDLYGVMSYSTEHLTTAAQHWDSTADQWERAFRQVNTQAQNLPWQGQAADATVQRTHGDMLVAVHRADQLREAATTARSVVSQLDALKNQVMQRVRDAQNDGFDVGDDYSVTDRYEFSDPRQAVQRQAMAETYSADLLHRSAALVARDHEVGVDIHSQAGDVGVGVFTGGNSGGGGKVQAGKYHGDGRVRAVDNTDGGAGAGGRQQNPPAIKVPPRQSPATVVNSHAGENFEPGKHPCPPSEVAKDTAEVIGGAAGIGAILAGEVPTAGLITSGLGAAAAGIIDGFTNLEKCE